MSISGGLAVVGAFGDDHAGNQSGSAYVFVRTGTSWSEEAKLTASDAAAVDRFGRFVSISGDLAIVGAVLDDDAGDRSGSAYVFRRTGTSWSEEAKLTASDAAARDLFGRSVSISGDLAIVGAHGHDDAGEGSGSAYIFRRTGTSWSEEVKFTASDAAASDGFGWSVSIDGARVIVGAPFDADAEFRSGSAYLYELSIAANAPPIADAGPNQTVEWTSDGVSVTLDGTGSSDPDGDPLTFSWTDANNVVVGTGPTATIDLGSLGSHMITLTVNDGQATDTDDVVINVVDTTPPDVTVALVPAPEPDDDDEDEDHDEDDNDEVDVDDDEGHFRVEFSCSDACDTNPTITSAMLNGIAVTNGQIVKLELEDDDGQEVEFDDGILEIEASSFALTVTCVDASGNVATATAVPQFAEDDDDDDDDDDEDDDDDDDDDHDDRKKRRRRR